ncbi:hypothetical protein EVAR_50720_1 [Eumeta japonica]|uniref:Uncharacterized protein n=1 Tax=Eumeta variegata TaxID=151549 RepID=A0A4C1YRL2_EUMVA|nr:hypothetical protein EVAR_50720_1 [Eumeta japonica]
MGLPRFCSASGMIAEAQTDDLHIIIRKRNASAVKRLRNNSSGILIALAERRISDVDASRRTCDRLFDYLRAGRLATAVIDIDTVQQLTENDKNITCEQICAVPIRYEAFSQWSALITQRDISRSIRTAAIMFIVRGWPNTTRAYVVRDAGALRSTNPGYFGGTGERTFKHSILPTVSALTFYNNVRHRSKRIRDVEQVFYSVKYYTLKFIIRCLFVTRVDMQDANHR